MHLKMSKHFLLICLLAAGIGQYEAALTYEFKPEIGCSRQGGLCVHEAECDYDFQVMVGSNLCPLQSSEGAVCCSKLPDLWTDCSRRGGDCVTRKSCPKSLTDERGICKNNKACCIFV